MLILLYGPDSFRSRQKLNQIIKQYQAKHQTGLNLTFFKEEKLNFEKVREKIEAVSMFDEKKLIILENVFKDKNFKEDFFQYSRKHKLKDNQDIVAVIYQEDKLGFPSPKKQLTMLEEFKLLEGNDLVNWIRKEIVERGGKIDSAAVNRLAFCLGNDLWQANNEIDKLISYKNSQPIKEEDIDLLVRTKLDLNIFKTIEALANRDKKNALRLLHQHFSQGANEIYLFSMFIYQLRSLIKLKDLIEKGTPYYNLAKKSGLHPFVVKKNWSQLERFNLSQLKKKYQRLLEIEISLKRGLIDGVTALDLFVSEI